MDANKSSFLPPETSDIVKAVDRMRETGLPYWDALGQVMEERKMTHEEAVAELQNLPDEVEVYSPRGMRLKTPDDLRRMSMGLHTAAGVPEKLQTLRFRPKTEEDRQIAIRLAKAGNTGRTIIIEPPEKIHCNVM